MACSTGDRSSSTRFSRIELKTGSKSTGGNLKWNRKISQDPCLESQETKIENGAPETKGFEIIEEELKNDVSVDNICRESAYMSSIRRD